MTTPQQVCDVLNTIIDPCSVGYVQAGIVEFGLVSDIHVDKGEIGTNIRVTIGVTEPGCPIGVMFAEQASALLEPLAEGGKVEVNLDLSGLWTEEKMASEYRHRLEVFRMKQRSSRHLPVITVKVQKAP